MLDLNYDVQYHDCDQCVHAFDREKDLLCMQRFETQHAGSRWVVLLDELAEVCGLQPQTAGAISFRDSEDS